MEKEMEKINQGKLLYWIEQFKAPDIEQSNMDERSKHVYMDIVQKFASFKNWAVGQIKKEKV